jgi:hypothetical protein
LVSRVLSLLVSLATGGAVVGAGIAAATAIGMICIGKPIRLPIISKLWMRLALTSAKLSLIYRVISITLQTLS